MVDNIEFITQPEETAEDLFEQYYEQTIVPLIEEDNQIKDKFRSQFWGYFWSACFLLGVNDLIVLFRRRMYNYPVSIEQLLVVTIVAAAIVCWPIYCYYKAPRADMFDAFLNFYGTWQRHNNTQFILPQTPIIPPHDELKTTYDIIGKSDDINIEMCDIQLFKNVQIKKWHFKREVSSGVFIRMNFNKKIKNPIYMLDKSGFYRKNKLDNYLNITSDIYVPAAGYFQIFSNDTEFAKDMLISVFFERILDLKETFKAKNLYIEMQDDYMLIYLEDTHLYFDNYSLWSHNINKDKFINLNLKMEQTIMTAQLSQALRID